MLTLNLSLLGGFDARLEPEEPLVFSTKKAMALLAYLAFHAGRPCARGTLGGLLWPYSAEEQARATLRQTLSTLRKSLVGFDGLKSQADQIVLSPEGLRFDVTAFEAAARAAEPSDWKRAAVLYRGELMAGLALRADGFENWLAIERERLRELALSVLVQLLAYHEGSGDVQSATDVAGQLLRIDATQEEAHRALMRLYLQQGRRGMALRQYELCVDALQRDLDIAPDADTTALYETVRSARQIRPVSAPTNEPFKGLATYEYEDAAIFYGRHRDIAATKQRLVQQASDGNAFLLIYGPSGCGKSSLARAGLLPALAKRGTIPGVDAVRHCVMRPAQNGDVMAGLVSTVVRCADVSCDAQMVLAQARQSPEAVIGPLRQMLSGDPYVTRIALLVDQLEEIFTHSGVDEHDRVRFVRLLAALAHSGFVWVVATMRSDFYSRCIEIPGLSELKDGFGSYELAPPTASEMFQIIREPARAAGVHFEADAKQGRLDDHLQQEAIRHPSSLPLLQFLLQALYSAGRDRGVLTFADYQVLGGLAGAVARHADDVVGALPTDARDALPSLLRSLVTIQSDEDMPTLCDIAAGFIETSPQRIILADALVDARLLVVRTNETDTATFRLVHEALLSRWPVARQLIAADRELLKIRARVRADCRRWEVENKTLDLLLPPGKRLAEAVELLATRKNELSQELIDFIAASEQAEKTRQEEALSAERERLKLAAAVADAKATAARRIANRTRMAAAIALMLAMTAAAGAIAGFKGRHDARIQADLALVAGIEAQRQAQRAQQARDEAVAARNRALRQVKVLISQGTSLNKSDAFGTPLHHAALNGHELVAELLIDAGADPNVAARDGTVPLHWAVIKGNIEIAKLLLDAGTDVNANYDLLGFGSPLHIAADGGQYEIAKLLIDRGADVQALKYEDTTPLHVAAAAGHAPMVKLLVDHGAEFAALGGQHWSQPLSYAADAGHADTVKLLLARGADSNVGGRGGATALHFAARRGDVGIIELLIDHGADLALESKDVSMVGTPLDVAIFSGHKAAADLLRQLGSLETLSR